MRICKRICKTIKERDDAKVEYLTTGEESSENYYVNPETRKLAQEIYQDPEMHMLFDAVRGSSAEEIKDFRDMILLMKRREKGD